MYITLCNGIISHGVQINGIWDLIDNLHRNKHKQNA